MGAIVLIVFFYVIHISNKIDELNKSINSKYENIIKSLLCLKENQQIILNEIEELRKEVKGAN